VTFDVVEVVKHEALIWASANQLSTNRLGDAEMNIPAVFISDHHA